METIIIIWIVGGLLAYPRMYASFYEIDEMFADCIKPEKDGWKYLAVSLLTGWIAFFTGIIIFYAENEKYFWKIDKKELYKTYHDNSKK